MSTPRYPLHLDLTGRRVLVVGAGPVAARRVRRLVDCGADVVVVAPDVSPGFPQVPVSARAFQPADVEGAWLVLACTGTVDADVARASAERGIWCVRADDAGASPAWVPAVATAEGVTVSVTAGGDPRRAVAVRDAVAAALDCGDLPLRRHRPGPGSVTVVPAATHPDLLTVAGRRHIAAADVVVRDQSAAHLDLAGAVDPDPLAHVVALAAAGHRVVLVTTAEPPGLGDACRRTGTAFEVVGR